MAAQNKSPDRTMLSVVTIVLAIVLFFSINIFSSTVFKTAQLDLTEERLYTLSQATRNILNDLDEPVTIRFYISDLIREELAGLANYANRVEELLREYERISGGRVNLEIFHPQQFSPEEDQAVGFGIQALPVSAAGEVVYFGLAGSNSTDDEDTIPFFNPGRETFLEYDLSKLIFNLSHPKKTLVALISALPMTADPRNRYAPWVIQSQMDQFFDVRVLGGEFDRIEDEVDIVMLVHPTVLNDRSQYAIEQFLLRGGKALIFVDPHPENYPRPQGQQREYKPPPGHALGSLFDAWGISMSPDFVVGDRTFAQRVNAQSGGRRIVTDFLPWMQLDRQGIEQTDVVTSEIERIGILSPGLLEVSDTSPLAMTPLLFSTPHSVLLEIERVRPFPDPVQLLTDFVASETRYPIAARFVGPLETMFPDGAPVRMNARDEVIGEDPNNPLPEHVAKSNGPVNMIVVADTDILADVTWLRGAPGSAQPVAQNNAFVVNALDNLVGSADLIALRGRGLSGRPFDTVETIRRDSELKFRAKERELVRALGEAERKIQELQQEDQGEAIMSVEQRRTIDGFRADMLAMRAELREVQHALVRDIDALDARLKMINIGAIPVIIGVFAIFLALFRRIRYNRRLRTQRS